MLKLVEENISSVLQCIGRYRGNFLNRTPMAQEMVPRINKSGNTKLHTSCIIKKNISRANRQPTGREKIFANSISDGV